jgi:uncharacterized protein
VLLIGGWQDLFFEQTMAHYRTLRNHGADVALIVGPWTHGEGGGVATRESLDWLAGSRLAHPVRIFVTGDGGWRELPDWPPPSTGEMLYPRPGGVLADAPPDDSAPLRFVYDPADPTPTIGGRMLMGSAAGYRDDSALAERADVLTFTGAELSSEFEVIGVPYVELTHATDTPSADVAVRISEVDPNGNSRNVSDGYLRVGPERSSPLRIDLDPIAHRFRPGHRIRLTIAGGSFPRFARNLGTGESLVSGTEFVRSTHVLDCAGSRLVLPRPRKQSAPYSFAATVVDVSHRPGRRCRGRHGQAGDTVTPTTSAPTMRRLRLRPCPLDIFGQVRRPRAELGRASYEAKTGSLPAAPVEGTVCSMTTP